MVSSMEVVQANRAMSRARWLGRGQMQIPKCSEFEAENAGFPKPESPFFRGFLGEPSLNYRGRYQECASHHKTKYHDEARTCGTHGLPFSFFIFTSLFQTRKLIQGKPIMSYQGVGLSNICFPAGLLDHKDGTWIGRSVYDWYLADSKHRWWYITGVSSPNSPNTTKRILGEGSYDILLQTNKSLLKTVMDLEGVYTQLLRWPSFQVFSCPFSGLVQLELFHSFLSLPLQEVAERHCATSFGLNIDKQNMQTDGETRGNILKGGQVYNVSLMWSWWPKSVQTHGWLLKKHVRVLPSPPPLQKKLVARIATNQKGDMYKSQTRQRKFTRRSYFPNPSIHYIL